MEPWMALDAHIGGVKGKKWSPGGYDEEQDPKLDPNPLK
jgi:hypothetical protein